MKLRGQGFENNDNYLFLVSTLYRTHHKYTILLYLRHIMFRLPIITPYSNKGANQILEQHCVATNILFIYYIRIQAGIPHNSKADKYNASTYNIIDSVISSVHFKFGIIR